MRIVCATVGAGVQPSSHAWSALPGATPLEPDAGRRSSLKPIHLTGRSMIG
jgi:hypothetical protein